MHRTLRASGLAASALLVAVFLAIASMFPPLFAFVAAAGTSVLVMGGTGNPLSTPPDTIEYVKAFTSAAVNNFVAPSSQLGSGIPGGPYNTVAVITPEESTNIPDSVARGLVNLDGCIRSTTCDYNGGIESTAPSPSDSFVVFGFSQSAAIAMLEKRKLAAEYAVGEGPDVTFVVIGNARPNGGLVARDPTGIFTKLVLGVSRDQLITEPAPTNTQYATVDIALQYDLFADAPLNPLNLLAVLNAYMGMLQLHPNYTDYSLTEPGVVDQGQYGDTHYYLISTPVLPLLMPLQTLGPAGAVLADALDPVLRVIVETAYDRSITPGEVVPFNPSYFPNPVKTAVNLLVAIPTGLDNALEDTLGLRPFGTQRPGPYGVGGPSPDYVDPESAPTASSKTDTKTEPAAATPTKRSSGVGHFRVPKPSVTDSAASSKSPRGSKSTGSSKPTASSKSGTSSHSGLGSSKRAR